MISPALRGELESFHLDVPKKPTAEDVDDLVSELIDMQAIAYDEGRSTDLREITTLIRELRALRPRINPAPSSREVENARKTWRMWHDKENPKKEYSVSERLLSESAFVPIGKAEQILYASDKWERDGDNHDYVHDFESHPSLYIPASQVQEGEAVGAKKATFRVLGLRAPRKSLAMPQLAKVRALSFRGSDGVVVEITGLRGAVMACSPDKKTLVILSKSGPILVRGGQMKVTKRGIVM